MEVYQFSEERIFKLLIFCLAINSVLTELQIVLDNTQCGRVFDLAKEKILDIYYEGVALGDFGESVCQINITNKNLNEMICLRKMSSVPDVHCDQALAYYVENLAAKPQIYSCAHFNNKPLCLRRNRSFIVFKQHDLTMALKIYSRTTRDQTAGAIGMVIIGAAGFVLFVLCMGVYVKYSSRRISVTNVEPGHQDVPKSDAESESESIFNENFPSGSENIMISLPPYFSELPPPYPDDS